jgi:hypothetical protein
MLIRSQDKTQLWNMNLIVYLDVEDNFCSSNNIVANYETNEEYTFRLGHYKSEEKAKKVLDMIEECYKSYPNNNVFQMPQDEELD